MKPLRLKIESECKEKNINQPVIEKDYALSYILAGIAQQPELKSSLIFKGGTALKKIYFGDYRFSEDLDFSVLNAPRDKNLENALLDAMSITKRLLSTYGPFDIGLKRYPESGSHPQGQEAFNIFIKFPWQSGTPCRIKVEITHDELIVLPPIHKPIIHSYGEELICNVLCYAIEEIIAEKMRTLLQTHQKLITRGWNRPRARDYYDLWRVLKNYHLTLSKENLLYSLNKKCEHRNIAYQNIQNFFTKELIHETHQYWQETLGVMVKDLPDVRLVIEETKVLIKNIIF